MDQTHVDGNAIVGALSIALGTDAAGASVVCAGCGRDHPVAEARVYLRCPGMVVRCPGCDGVEIVLTEIRHRLEVGLGGVTRLQFAPATG